MRCWAPASSDRAVLSPGTSPVAQIRLSFSAFLCHQDRGRLRKLTCRCAHPYPGAGLTDFQLEQIARRRQVIARVRRVVSPVERRQAQQKSLAKDDEQEFRPNHFRKIKAPFSRWQKTPMFVNVLP